MFTNAKYLEVNDALDYFQYRLNNDSWISSTKENREKALITATRVIDNLPLRGFKTDEDQDLQFPRDGSESVPEDILIACCEIAFELLDSVDLNLTHDSIFIQSTSSQTARVGYNSKVPQHIAYGVPSYIAWQKLKPYILDPQQVKLERVS